MHATNHRQAKARGADCYCAAGYCCWRGGVVRHRTHARCIIALVEAQSKHPTRCLVRDRCLLRKHRPWESRASTIHGHHGARTANLKRTSYEQQLPQRRMRADAFGNRAALATRAMVQRDRIDEFGLQLRYLGALPPRHLDTL